jgi:HK97 family phage portal protein
MNLLQRFSRWLYLKSMPSSLGGGQWTGTSFQDSFKRFRNPTANELMAELKNTAWTCASLNACVCASYPPSLYVTTRHNQPRAKCSTRPLSAKSWQHFKKNPRLMAKLKAVDQIEEVTEHPLLTLLKKPNDQHNQYDLWELTTLYQEVHGLAYWYLDMNPLLGIPKQVWILPAQNVTPKRVADSNNIVDFYAYRTGSKENLFTPDTIVQFRYPDPRDPYLAGLSPLKACFEQVACLSDYNAMRQAKFNNSAIPDALITPDEVVGEEERDRLESQWNQRFRKAGTGRVVVAESSMKVQLLNHSLGDLQMLAEMGKTKEDIANAFHVPISYLTTNTNLANLQASVAQHMQMAIAPRLERRDEKINEQLVPLYDPSGRLFVASQDPIPVDQELSIQQQEADMKYGIVSINEVRNERGLPAVPWGDAPWLPRLWAQTDDLNRNVKDKPPTTDAADAGNDNTIN